MNAKSILIGFTALLTACHKIPCQDAGAASRLSGQCSPTQTYGSPFNPPVPAFAPFHAGGPGEPPVAIPPFIPPRPFMRPPLREPLRERPQPQRRP